MVPLLNVFWVGVFNKYNMKLKIQTYKYEKVAVKDDEIFIPDEPFYCFQTGVRRSIRIVPKRVGWETEPGDTYQKGDIWKINVTCVYQHWGQCMVEKLAIQLSQMEDYANGKWSQTDPKESGIVNLLYTGNYHVRTKEEFEQDLNAAIKQFQDENSN
jgi:hypothetical protein